MANTIGFEIDWADCDPADIVFYPQFFRMMNTGTHKLFEAAGLPYPLLTKRYTPTGTPLLNVNATFRSPARFGDKVALTSEIAEWRNSTFVVSHVMHCGERVIFEASEVRVWAVPDPEAANGIKAARVPDEVRAMFDATRSA